MPLKFSKQIYRSGYKIELLVLKKKRDQFHIIGIMRRLADYYLNKAPTLDEMKKAHRKFIQDYNCQIHFVHRERQDNRHSPEARAARRLGAYSSSTNPGPYFLCHRVYPPTGRDQGISAFADGASTLRRGLPSKRFRFTSTPARSRSNIKTQSWRCTRWSGQRITNT